MSSRDWALTVFVACVIAVIALAAGNLALAVFVFFAVLALAWAIFDPWIKGHLFARWVKLKSDPRVDSDLRRRCRQLGQQIAFFAAKRRTDDPGHVPHWYGLPEDATEEQKNQAFNQHSQNIIGYMTETMTQYSVHSWVPP